MVKKILIILSLVLLTACKNNKQVACILNKEDKEISLDIKAINDDITSISVRASFLIPNCVINNEEYYAFLCKQLNKEFHFEDNLLVKEYEIVLDKNYSFNKTIEYLKNKRYFCE